MREQISKPQGFFNEGSFVERWRIERPGGLTGATLRVEGIAASVTDVIVRIERQDGTSQVERLLPARPEFTVQAASGVGEVAWSYFVLGVEHILGGIDHLLFVLALLLDRARRPPHRRDDHRVHGRTQHHARLGDTRLGARAGAAGRGDDRAEHRVRRR